MNEFTKEELETISYCLIKKDEGNSSAHKKTQSMIDNYLEYESKNRKLLINTIKVPGKDNWDITFRWEGLKGCRCMLLEIERHGFSLCREGVKDIKRMCEEFLKNEDMAHKFLRIENDNQ